MSEVAPQTEPQAHEVSGHQVILAIGAREVRAKVDELGIDEVIHPETQDEEGLLKAIQDRMPGWEQASATQQGG